MRVLIISDLEGVNGVLNFDDWCTPAGFRNEAGCRFLTEEVNAAVAGFSLFTDISYEDWRRFFALNVDAAFLLTKELLPTEILQFIPELKEQKQQGNEKTVIPLPESLYNFYIKQKEQTLQLLATMKYQHPDNSALNNLFVKLVKKSY